MDEIVDEARRLGDRIASDPRTRALRDASRAVEADEAARALQEEYAREVEQIHAVEAAGRPLSPDLERRAMELAERVRRSPPLQALLRAHAQFNEMMEGVQEALGRAVDSAMDGGPADDRPRGGTILVP